MGIGNRVSVDPAKAVSCSWCGTYESDKWRYDSFRSSVWCSRSCYWAGHFGEFVCSTVAIVIIDFFLISVMLWSPTPPYPLALYLIGFFLLMTILTALASVHGYSIRKKTPKFG